MTPPTDPSAADGARRLLVVVAHPDDETFGCGSLLAAAAEHGVRATVACATRGESGEPAPGSGVDPQDLATVREAELHAAADLLGVERVELFGWCDSGMSGDAPEGALVRAPLEEVAAAVHGLLRDVAPDIVITLDASDGHRDHVHIRDATLRAVGRLERPPRTYLQCLPRSLMVRWAEEVRVRNPGSAYLELGELGTPDDELTTVLDARPFLELRQQAIDRHASQVPPFAVMSPEMREAFLGTDHLKRVVPPWDGGAVERQLFSGESAATDAGGTVSRPGPDR